MDDFNTQYVRPVSAEAESVRATFLQKTYMHVALAVLGFILVEAAFLNTPFIVEIGLSMTQGWTWLFVLLGFGFASSYVENMAHEATEKSTQYLALGLFVVLYAFLFVPLIYMAIAATGGFALLQQAGVLSASLFTGLSAVAILSGKDFSFMKTGLTIGFVIAFGLIIAGILFGFDLGLWFSVAMVVLAAGSIIYQTSQIMHTHHTEQYVAASVGLFGALMLLFWYIIQILMSFSGD